MKKSLIITVVTIIFIVVFNFFMKSYREQKNVQQNIEKDVTQQIEAQQSIKSAVEEFRSSLPKEIEPGLVIKDVIYDEKNNEVVNVYMSDMFKDMKPEDFKKFEDKLKPIKVEEAKRMPTKEISVKANTTYRYKYEDSDQVIAGSFTVTPKEYE